MNRSLRIFAFVLLLASASYAGEAIELKWKSFNDGLKEAKTSNKKILVDVFTDWCKWCKVMDRDVYGNKEIATYLSQQYILVKLNAEGESSITYKDNTGTETELAGAFGVTGYPTTLFLEPNGELITPVPGFVPADKFIDIITFLGENHYKTMNWDAYQKNKTQPPKKK